MLENMFDYIRITLYTLLAIILFFLYQAWEKEHPKVEAPAVQTQSISTNRYIPETNSTQQTNIAAANSIAAPTSVEAPISATSETGKLVHVKTDLLEADIDTRGGDIVSIKLLQYPESLSDKAPFKLLNDDDQTRYIAESGLLSQQGPDTVKEQALYSTSQSSYVLEPGQDKIDVVLTWSRNNLNVTKTFTFSKNTYEVNVKYDISNKSNSPWVGNLFTQLMRKNTPPATHGGFINLSTYFGAAVSSVQKPFEKVPFKDMQEKNLNQVIQGGWAAMIQHYFISAWIPAQNATSTYYSKVTPDGLYTIGMIGQPLTVEPGARLTTGAKLYAGPSITQSLEQAAPKLSLTIDYGWFWYISGILFWMMKKIYDIVQNWGWSIVLVTVIIKLLFYQLSNKSYRSMSAMKRLQPKIEMLKERYGADKQQLTKATFELYKQEKVNPMSGCLPILIQIPVFIALYSVLVESVELRQAPFILWIHDLSQPDPYYVLPVLMGLSMFFQQRLNPPPPDPLQAKIMMFMPVIFTVLFMNFPAGLMLYWFVNNTLSFLQQWHIMHRLEKENAKKRS